ncbi:MAG: hypothetical protein ABIC40_07090 [bacterium]
MKFKAFISCLTVLGFFFAVSSLNGQDNSARTGQGWDIPATAKTIASWTGEQVFSDRKEIRARILSTKEDGCFIDAGSGGGVTVGQNFEVYEIPRDNSGEKVIGIVQVKWTRDDYSFCEPRGGLSMEDVTVQYFVRTSRAKPNLWVKSETSSGTVGPEFESLIRAVQNNLGASKNVNLITSEGDRSDFKLVLAPDPSGYSVRASIVAPDATITGSIVVNLLTGERITGRFRLDPSYIAKTASPFEHFLAPPGRRAVRIASGDIIPGSGDELAVLDGSDLWVYDLSGSQAKLLSSLSVSIPPADIRHRSDSGSLELIDLDGDGQVEVCIAPPGGSRGEIRTPKNDDWVLLAYLPYPARASATSIGGVLVAPFLSGVPAFDPQRIQWSFPLSENDPIPFNAGFAPVSVDMLPAATGEIPSVIALDIDGILHKILPNGTSTTFGGTWGDMVRVAESGDGPVIIVSSNDFFGDSLILLDPSSGKEFARFPSPGGPIIDIALGDIDRDANTEILVAVLDSDGIKIYF